MTHCPPTIRSRRRPARRGNTMVLVASILVLLVIIATAFITRAQAGREMSVAQRSAAKRTDTSRFIADDIAQLVADHLFVRRIWDTANPNNSNQTRMGIFPDAIRYGYDIDNNPITPNFPYNFAPYHTVPYTNWPDADSFIILIPTINQLLPAGPGNVGGGVSDFLNAEGNPLGNPGFGDTRWLRDLEPLRIDSDEVLFPLDGQLDGFTHYRHLTNIATANNGWRICRDISDIFDNEPAPVGGDGNGGLLFELNIPVEQWLADPVPHAQQPLLFAPGNMQLNRDLYFAEWRNWFNPGYFNAYLNGNNSSVAFPGPPANFYDLSAYGPASDEFIFDSERNMISRILADADGDGFTDSFWFLSPAPPDSDIRQVVAVSITDNSGRINANVATEFNRRNTVGATPADLAMVGDYLWNDGASAATFTNHHERVGFLDSFRNNENAWRYNPGNPGAPDPWDVDSLYRNTAQLYDIVMWDFNANSNNGALPENYLGALGVLLEDVNLPAGFDLNINLPSTIFNSLIFPPAQWAFAPAPLSVPIDRLFYWQAAGSKPFSASYGFTPFGLDTEIELRMFEGQNYPWIMSPLENAVQSRLNNEDDLQLFRANIARAESSEYLDQLNARELLFDNRRKMTTYSGARNDLMPPWLWWRWNAPPEHTDLNGDGIINPGIPAEVFAFNNYLAQARTKLDLREKDPVDVQPMLNLPEHLGELTFNDRLASTLMLALTDGSELGGEGYHGPYLPNVNPDSTIQQTRKLAASFAANIKAYRDPDTDTALWEAEPLPQLGNLPRDVLNPGSPNDHRRYLGLEAQPFLLEAFVGHIYKAVEVPSTDSTGTPYGNSGDFIVLDDETQRSSVIVVQIANPFDVPIDLTDYRIRVFGQIFSPTVASIMPGTGNALSIQDLDGDAVLEPVLMPAKPDDPTTAVFIAIRGTITGLDNIIDDIGTWPITGPTGKWFDFLDIEHEQSPSLLQDLTDNSLVFNATFNDQWEVSNRCRLDGLEVQIGSDTCGTANEENAIELLRFVRDDPNVINSGQWVVVDRIDDPDMPDNETFREAVNELREDRPEDMPSPLNSPPGSPIQPYPFGYDIHPNTHWVQWARVTRAWGADFDAIPLSPINYDNDERNPRYVSADRAITSSRKVSVFQEPSNGDEYFFAASPDLPTPWFTEPFLPIQDVGPGGDLPTDRKPTFFDMRKDADPLPPRSYPDKGWYGQINNLVDRELIDPDVHSDIADLSKRIHLNFAMQMLQKDRNFDQVGELLNVWLYTHELRFSDVDPDVFPWTVDVAPVDRGTVQTFSEALALDRGFNQENEKLVGVDRRLNRLHIEPLKVVTDSGDEWISPVIGVLDVNAPLPYNAYNDRLAAVPNLPAGARVLDAFVCDGPGVLMDYDGDGFINFTAGSDDRWVQSQQAFNNASGFSGRITPGLININTATVEVMRALPHMDVLVHVDPNNDQVTNNFNDTQFVAVSNAIIHYRERFTGTPKTELFPNVPRTGYPRGANYQNRIPDVLSTDERGDRGIVSIGELMLLNKDAVESLSTDVPPLEPGMEWRTEDAWKIGFAGEDPFGNTLPAMVQSGGYLSTDVQGANDSITSGDSVTGDVEEANLLFAGISNLITTRSDVFTVHLKIRSFKKNPVTGIWDATDVEQIVDERRYVMLVDRSRVETPGDKPRILYLEKLPN